MKDNKNPTKEENLNTSKLIHELRNTLTLLKGNAQLIEGKHSEIINTLNWKQMNELIIEMESMLNDASSFQNCSSLNFSHYNLIDIFQTLVSQYESIAQNKDVTIKLRIVPDCVPYYESYFCDSYKLKQAFSNLIKNALEACVIGNTVEVVLDLTYYNNRPSRLCIEIKDDGLCISSCDMQSIFDPFVTHKSGGTGLGLPIVKKTIELHQGNIFVSSTEKETCFKVLLPLPDDLAEQKKHQ